MKKIIIVFIVFISFCLSAQQKLKVAVLNFEDRSEKMEADLLSAATDSLHMYLESFERYSVIPKAQQDEALSQAEGCNDKLCRIKFGQTLGANLVAYPYITLANEQYTIKVEVIDVAKQSVPISVAENWNGEEDSLASVSEAIVKRIKAKQKNLDALSSNFAADVIKEQDKELCENARSGNNVKNWEKYLKEFPDGQCAEEAKASLADFNKAKEKETCEKARTANERSQKREWEKYLKEFPDGQCAEEAKASLADFNRLKDKETCEKARTANERSQKRAWEKYLKEYPEGQCVEEARNFINNH